jgi:hypothetical protein
MSLASRGSETGLLPCRHVLNRPGIVPSCARRSKPWFTPRECPVPGGTVVLKTVSGRLDRESPPPPEEVGAVAITVDHQPREDNTVAHRDRLHRQREVFERDYKDGDTPRLRRRLRQIQPRARARRPALLGLRLRLLALVRELFARRHRRAWRKRPVDCSRSTAAPTREGRSRGGPRSSAAAGDTAPKTPHREAIRLGQPPGSRRLTRFGLRQRCRPLAEPRHAPSLASIPR